MAILDTATETRSILSGLHQKIFKLSGDLRLRGQLYAERGEHAREGDGEIARSVHGDPDGVRGARVLSATRLRHAAGCPAAANAGVPVLTVNAGESGRFGNTVPLMPLLLMFRKFRFDRSGTISPKLNGPRIGIGCRRRKAVEVAFERLDLDHIGTEVAEDLRREGAEQDRRDVDDA